MDFPLACVALRNPLQEILRQSKEEQFARNLQITAGQKADKLSIVLQLTKGAFGLDGNLFLRRF